MDPGKPKAGKWLSLAVQLKQDRQNGHRPNQKRVQDDSDLDRAFAGQPQRRPNTQDLAKGIPLDDDGPF
jgi:hypothetical protein